MSRIGYITFDDIARNDNVFLMTKDNKRIGYMDRNDVVDACRACRKDHGTYDDPVLFRYFKNIKLHPSQYTIERVSA